MNAARPPAARDAATLDFNALLRAGDGVVIAQMAGEPVTLAERLYAARGLPEGVSVFIGASVTGTPLAARGTGLRLSSYGALFRTAEIARSMPVDIYPLHYSRIGSAITGGALPCAVALLQVARDESTGRLYAGTGRNYMFEAARRARVVVAELNRRAPVIPGGELPDDLPIHHLIESDREIPEQSYGEPGADEVRIATHVAGLVEDGATIQVGVGSLAGALLAALSGHRHLGFHSGLINDDVMRLMQSGAIDNSRKSIDAGVAVLGNPVGSRALYDFVHGNPQLRMAGAAYTHVRETLARIDNLTALNSGLQVDLAGQVNAEAAGTRYLGGVGGLADFVRGALAARGGRSIIAMPSCARGGAVSRIVARLDGPATLGATDADCIVTEWGVAHLRDRTLAERARAVIAIAHPDHREPLLAAARAAGLA
ncbi:MAG: acetyl-CoA hydrolase [Burkholderiales bacterium]|nr:acetyl-CoA hydrolase [Burkholderiales bacterium]